MADIINVQQQPVIVIGLEMRLRERPRTINFILVGIKQLRAGRRLGAQHNLQRLRLQHIIMVKKRDKASGSRAQPRIRGLRNPPVGRQRSKA